MSRGEAFDPAAPLVPSGNLRRRQLFSRVAEHGATAAAVFAVGVLAIVVYTVFTRGAKALNLDFIVQAAPAGIGPELVGTAIIVAIATMIAMPLGVLIALFLTEFAGNRSVHAIRLMLDLMNGLPSIIIGLFIFELMVNHRQQSALGGLGRPRDHRVAADRPRQPGGAAARPRQAARSGRRARGESAGEPCSGSSSPGRSAESSLRRCSPSRAPPARPRR